MGRRLAARSAADPAPGSGCAEASDWVRVFESQFDYVYWTLRHFGATPVDAEDIAQEVFLAMWRRRAAYDPHRPVRPWIAGIAFRSLQEHRRRSQRELPGGLVDAPDESPCADEHLEAVQARTLVLEALARVPPKQRAVLVMHDLESLSMREIASALSVPLFTLYSRLKCGRRAFAKEVRRAEVLSSVARAAPAAALLAQAAAHPPAPRAARQRSLRRLRCLLLGSGSGGELPGRGPPARAPSSHPEVAPARPSPPLALGASIFFMGALLAILLGTRLARQGALAAPAVPGRDATALATTALGAARNVPTELSGWRTRTAANDDARAASAALAKGLVGYWRFDDSRGSVAARDLSGEGNDCVMRRLDPETAWGDGTLGGALSLRGRGWLECPVTGALAGLEQELTIAAWVTRGTVVPHYHALVARQKDAGRQDEFMFGFADGGLVFASHVWSGKVIRPLPEALGQWFHIAVTRSEDGTVILFVGGVEIGRGHTRRAALDGGGNPLVIGAAVNGWDPARTQAHFDGAVDELVIYDRALAPHDIESLAARHQPALSP